ncbi:MAG: ATP-binding protein, partial [Candidatus Angelobacter sp.]
MKKKLLLSWSSGKDSAWALHLLRQRKEYEIAGLLTTLNSTFDRVAMHSTHRTVLEAQAEAAGLSLISIPLPWPCSNAEYEQIMRRVCEQAVAKGVQSIGFGDLFLEDIRSYRERQLRDTGLEPIFPLWQKPTRE